MNAQLINPFVNSTVKVLETMAQVKPVAGKPFLKQGNKSWGVITGLIGMAGSDVTGNLIISFDEPCILEIVGNMLMEKYTAISDEVVDAVGEITNMISGGTKAELSEQGFRFEMATPCMFRGQGVELAQLGHAQIISIPFETPSGKFVVEASLAQKANGLA